VERARFVPSLEAVRGLAALTVCLYHAAYDVHIGGAPIAPPPSPQAILFNGEGAVILFFVLSGFVLRLALERRRDAPALPLAAEFLTVRAFRLYPVVVATVALFAVVAWAEGRAYPAGLIATNAALLDATINGVFWTLQIEVVGSVAVLGAFLIERSIGLWPLIVVAILLAPMPFLGTHGAALALHPLRFYEGFVLGYLLAAAPWRLSGDAAPRWLLAVAIGVFYLGRALGAPFANWSMIVTELGAVGLVAALSTESLGRALSWSPIRWLGVLSYSFYAVHLLGDWSAKWLAARLEALAIPAWLIAVAALATAVAVTLPIAVAMRSLVEKPCLAVGRDLVRRVATPAPAAA